MNLRFIERDGQKVLQEYRKLTYAPNGGDGKWTDVPLVQEPREWLIDANNKAYEKIDIAGITSARYSGEHPKHPLIRVREVLE